MQSLEDAIWCSAGPSMFGKRGPGLWESELRRVPRLLPHRGNQLRGRQTCYLIARWLSGRAQFPGTSPRSSSTHWTRRRGTFLDDAREPADIPGAVQGTGPDPQTCRLTGNYLVSGPPGTGKTVMALYRAHALEIDDRPASLLMHGNVLSQYTRLAAKGLGIEASVATFHSWLRNVWRNQLPRQGSYGGAW